MNSVPVVNGWLLGERLKIGPPRLCENRAEVRWWAGSADVSSARFLRLVHLIQVFDDVLALQRRRRARRFVPYAIGELQPKVSPSQSDHDTRVMETIVSTVDLGAVLQEDLIKRAVTGGDKHVRTRV